MRIHRFAGKSDIVPLSRLVEMVAQVLSAKDST
jgi:hypothetical protein